MAKVCTVSVLRVTALLLVFAGSTTSSAQQSAPPADQNRQNQDQDQSSATLQVNVNVVQLFFNVKDKKGGLIPNLAKTDFDILEAGKPQGIKYFAAEANL